MSPRSWMRTLWEALGPRAVRKAAVPYRPSLEGLEDRALPALAFHPAVAYAAGDGPLCVAVGDFNGDGKKDLATANERSGTVSVLLGQGGTFQGAVHYGAGIQPYSVAVGDFNGDGKQDL